MSIYKDNNYHWSGVDDINSIIDTFINVVSTDTTIHGVTKDVIFDIPKDENVEIVLTEDCNFLILLYNKKGMYYVLN